MKNRFLIGSTLSLVFGALGCGGDSVAIDDIDQAYIEGFCESMRRCETMGDGEVSVIARVVERETNVSCEELLERAGFAQTPRELTGVEEGTIDYNGARARKCMDALVRTCVPFEELEVLPECRGIFEGTVAIGAQCRASAECVPGSYCANDLSCAGTCTAQVAIGASCTRGDHCLDPEGEAFTSCNTTDENPVPHCVVTNITLRVGLGETCGQIDDSGDEQAYALCGPGLFCNYAEEEDTGVCAEPLAPGSPCENGDSCQNGACGDGFCLEITMRKSPNEACDFSEGIFCDGTQHLACNPETEVCEQVGDGTVGSPCTMDGDFLLSLLTCDRGLYCDDELETPSCQSKKALGAICENDDECTSNYCSEDERCAENAPLCEPFEI